MMEYVLIISMGMQNVLGGMPSTNSYQELLIPMDSKEHCESKVEDFSGLDIVINGYQLFLMAECLPGNDYQEPDLETYRDCHESPQSSLPKHCKGVEFLDDSDEQG